MDLNVTKEEYMNDQVAFEFAMRRVQNQAHREGKKPNFRELLDLAKVELEEEYERNKAIAASLSEDA